MNQEVYTSSLVAGAFLVMETPQTHAEWIAFFLVVPLSGWALGRLMRLLGFEVNNND